MSFTGGAGDSSPSSFVSSAASSPSDEVSSAKSSVQIVRWPRVHAGATLDTEKPCATKTVPRERRRTQLRTSMVSMVGGSIFL